MVEFKQVKFEYCGDDNNKNGISEIDFKVSKGEMILLCGCSGCGKSTILRIINGLIPNFYHGELTGNAIICGKNYRNMSLKYISEFVGSVFQNPRTQFFSVDVMSELAFGCENQCIDENEIVQRIKKHSPKLGIEKLLDRNIFSLSGGEKQKIAISAVSILNPSIVVLDEPSSNLDVFTIEYLRKILKEWKSEGKTIIIAEHKLYYLYDLVDKMLYIKDGKVDFVFNHNEIIKLNKNKLEEYGLRAMNLNDIDYYQNKYEFDKNLKWMELSNFMYTNKENFKLNIKKCEIPENKIIALIGHNGAGKSTLARCICGLEKDDAGIMVINDCEFKSKDRLKLCYMVMKDVNHQLFMESVWEEVKVGLDTKEDKEIALILEKLNLQQYVDKHPMSLSGGEKQRLAIATAILSDRKIVVFDEPTSGLDLCHMKEFVKQVDKLKQMNRTVIVITHDYEFIMKSCDYIVHLENGEVNEKYFLDKDGKKKLRNFFFAGYEV